MSTLTAIILTKNEEKNIKKCIESILDLCDRIVVIDSGSTDKTIEIVQQYGIEIYSNPFKNYASQFNWAIDNCDIKTKWILRIDADEVIPSNLKIIIKNKIFVHKDDDINGIILRLKVYFLGKWIKHGGTYPFRKMMLFKYGIGRIENREMDEHTILLYGRSIEIKEYDVEHYDFKDITFWINKHNWYSSRETQDYFNETDRIKINVSDKNLNKTRGFKRIYYKFPLFLRVKIYYFYRMYFRLGFLDGTEGRIYQFLHAYWYRYLVDVKIYEKNKNK